MNPDRAARLSRRLAFAADRGAVGSIAVEGLLDLCEAQGAVAWLADRSDTTDFIERRPRGSAVFVAGELLTDAPTHEIASAFEHESLHEWFGTRGASAARVTDASRTVRLAVAWTRHVPPAAATTLELMAGHLSAVVERLDTDLLLATTRTSLRDFEREIAQTRRVRALGEMASGIVHDFNNCLTTILGYTELALGPLEQMDGFYNDLSTIRTAALDAAALVRRLQTMSRPQGSGDEREIVDVREIIRVMPRLAQPRYSKLAQCEGVTFDIAVDPGPAPPVNVSVSEIRELLLNLLFNAVDAMPHGGRITIASRTVDGEAEITVTDQGQGMSPEVLNRVFEPFFSTKGDRGYGLGLAVCQSIADRHGGQLSAGSTEGSGSTFTLRLPAAPAELLPPVDVARAPDRTTGDRLIILLVDDQHEVRESVGDMLRALGHEVVLSDDGNHALTLAMRNRIDVIMTDLGMPGMNGIDLAGRLRVAAPETPVVLLTGWGLEDRTLPENVAIVLNKPITMKLLTEALAVCAESAHGVGSRRLQCS
jgi:signal transduction histidine kinase/CheY-like chemotaxis protein